jgi:hypothetical protein
MYCDERAGASRCKYAIRAKQDIDGLLTVEYADANDLAVRADFFVRRRSLCAVRADFIERLGPQIVDHEIVSGVRKVDGQMLSLHAKSDEADPHHF